MSKLSKPYSLKWPLTARQLDEVDEMFAKLYRNTLNEGASPTTTEGDIIFNDGSADERLAIGSQYSVLQSSATRPFWGLLDLANSVTGLLNIASHVSGILAVANGGTGKDNSAVTDGQLLIGKTSGHSLELASIIAGTNVTVTPGPGTLQIDLSPGAIASLTPIVTSGSTSIGAGVGMVVPESFEISAGDIFEIAGGARAEITGPAAPHLCTFTAKLTTSQLLKLDVAPFAIVPGTIGANFNVIPISLVCRLNTTSTGGSAQNLRLRNHGSTTDLITPFAFTVASITDRVTYAPIVANLNSSGAGVDGHEVYRGALELSLSGSPATFTFNPCVIHLLCYVVPIT